MTSLFSLRRSLETDADVMAFVDNKMGEKEGEVTPSLRMCRRVASSRSSRTPKTTYVQEEWLVCVIWEGLLLCLEVLG